MTEASDRTGPAPVRIAVPRERQPGELRVALVPATLRPLLAAGLQVTVEAGAGAGHADAAYTEAGATVVADLKKLLANADVVLHVSLPSAEEVKQLAKG